MSGETKQRIGDLEAEIARLMAAQPTLRDQFAMAALATIGAMTSDCMAEAAYQIADAMMEVRDEKTN